MSKKIYQVVSMWWCYPQMFNCAIFSMDSLATFMLWFRPAFRGWDMNTDFVSFVFTYFQINLPASCLYPIRFFVARVTTFFERKSGPYFGDKNGRNGGMWGGAHLLAENSSHHFFKIRARKCTGSCGRNVLDLFSRRGPFETRPEYLVILTDFSWFPSVPPGKCQVVGERRLVSSTLLFI
jgi:hypothetical protein